MQGEGLLRLGGEHLNCRTVKESKREKECLGKWKSKRFSFCIWRIERYGDIKMAHNSALLEGIASEIKEILYGYVKVKSTSNSPVEKEAEQYFLNYFRSLPYWQAHPEYLGTCPAVNDPFNRAAAFAMVRGSGDDTIVMIHHNDVVSVEDFKRLAPLAYSPDELEQELRHIRNTLPEEVRQDLESGEYLYGRGVCDMKGGGSIQMAVLNRYSQLVAQAPNQLPGTLIVLAVPDEENLSAGMRAGIRLLVRLREQYGLRYRIMIDSEPHLRKDPEKGLFSVGSVGKLLPFVYVRGVLSHAGKPFEGLNPSNLLSEIVRRTEINTDFCDEVEGEVSPPPTWLYQRDRKLEYDVSIPLSAAGCLSVLTFHQTPISVLQRLKTVCEESFQYVLTQMNASYANFLKMAGKTPEKLPWQVKTVEFEQLYQEALAAYGDVFRSGFQAELDRLKQQLVDNQLTMLDCNFALVDFIYNFVDDLSPRVIYGLIPPYYPNVANLFLPDLPDLIRTLQTRLSDDTQEQFGQEYLAENFFVGISDLSYSSISHSQEITQTLKRTMPLYGHLYDLPLEQLESISMPCINIGPWGKDLHKMTERVFKQDLYERTPYIIQRAIETVFGICG